MNSLDLKQGNLVLVQTDHSAEAIVPDKDYQAVIFPESIDESVLDGVKEGNFACQIDNNIRPILGGVVKLFSSIYYSFSSKASLEFECSRKLSGTSIIPYETVVYNFDSNTNKYVLEADHTPIWNFGPFIYNFAGYDIEIPPLNIPSSRLDKCILCYAQW